jgi:hypothetical protein
MADVIYNAFKVNQMKAKFPDLSVGTNIKVALVNATYAAIADEVKKDTHTTFADVVANEITGTAYTARGQQITSPTVTQDDTNNLAKFDFADTTWAASTITANGAVVYLDSGVNSTSYLIAYIDFVGTKSSSAGNFTIQWNAGGVVTLT